MGDKVAPTKPMLKYCPDRYKAQKICDKVVDACLSAWKFVPNSPVTSKMLQKHEHFVFSHDDIDSDDRLI